MTTKKVIQLGGLGGQTPGADGQPGMSIGGGIGGKGGAQHDLSKYCLKYGVYQHYKGGFYLLYAMSVHEEDLDLLVHYYSFEKGFRWTRTYQNFIEEVDGSPRFRWIRPGSIHEFLVAYEKPAFFEERQMLTTERDEDGNPKSAIGIDDRVEAQLRCFYEEHVTEKGDPTPPSDAILRVLRAAYRCGWAQCEAKARETSAQQGEPIGVTEHGDKVYPWTR